MISAPEPASMVPPSLEAKIVSFPSIPVILITASVTTSALNLASNVLASKIEAPVMLLIAIVIGPLPVIALIPPSATFAKRSLLRANSSASDTFIVLIIASPVGMSPALL